MTSCVAFAKRLATLAIATTGSSEGARRPRLAKATAPTSTATQRLAKEVPTISKPPDLGRLFFPQQRDHEGKTSSEKEETPNETAEAFRLNARDRVRDSTGDKEEPTDQCVRLVARQARCRLLAAGFSLTTLGHLD